MNVIWIWCWYPIPFFRLIWDFSRFDTSRWFIQIIQLGQNKISSSRKWLTLFIQYKIVCRIYIGLVILNITCLNTDENKHFNVQIRSHCTSDISHLMKIWARWHTDINPDNKLISCEPIPCLKSWLLKMTSWLQSLRSLCLSIINLMWNG